MYKCHILWILSFTNTRVPSLDLCLLSYEFSHFPCISILSVVFVLPISSDFFNHSYLAHLNVFLSYLYIAPCYVPFFFFFGIGFSTWFSWSREYYLSSIPFFLCLVFFGVIIIADVAKDSLNLFHFNFLYQYLYCICI